MAIPTKETISGYVLGDDLHITRTIRDVPADQGITDAWLTIKRFSSDADVEAMLQRHITSVFVNGTGQITDDGNNPEHTAAVLFIIFGDDYGEIAPRVQYQFDIQVKTDQAVYATPFVGTITFLPEITLSR